MSELPPVMSKLEKTEVFHTKVNFGLKTET